MVEVSQVLLEAARQRKDILVDKFRIPSITAYNRLEPRARTENFERSLRAEIRDPLWMLTRQWQMGELEAEDCGSPIDARITTKEIQVDRIALNGGTGTAYNNKIPMECFVEKETVQFTHALRLQVTSYFLKLHSPALRTKYLGKYQEKFGIDPVDETKLEADINGLNLYRSTKVKGIDGEKILAAIAGGTLVAQAAIEPGDVDAINTAADQLSNWFRRAYFQPNDDKDVAWRPTQLDYQFSIAAPESANSQQVLDASEYHGGRLDWYSFDTVLRPQLLGTDDQNAQPHVKKNTISFIPVTPSFKGIPNARFWEMEDRQIDFGKMNAKTSDLLLLAFTEFGLIYANDWFMLPYRMPVNTLCEIRGLVVTDVFGDRTLIRAADEGPDSEWQRWSMYNLSNKGHIGEYNRQFFLPPALTQNLESDPIEEVHYIRDEMANMCWGIESIIPDQTSQGIDGNLAADKSGVIIPAVEPDETAHIRYLLGNSVPENWIPFIPVHKPGSVQDIRFQRATMPKFDGRDVIKAKGRLLTEVASPYYINSEEIPYSGTIISRSFQRTRWLNGQPYVWLGRYRQTGRGQGSSNLMFDQILPVNDEKIL
jgi:hypothetical protein